MSPLKQLEEGALKKYKYSLMLISIIVKKSGSDSIAWLSVKTSIIRSGKWKPKKLTQYEEYLAVSFK